MSDRTAWTVAAALLATIAMQAAPVYAQVGLPQVQTPALPIELPIDVNRTLDNAFERTDPRQLRELRRVRIRDLLRSNRQTLEADPRGAPIVRSEIVALSPSEQALQQAAAAGFEVGRRQDLAGLEMTTVVLRAPAGMSTRRALGILRRNDPTGVYDFNHLYIGTGVLQSAQAASASAITPAVAAGARVGLIDAGIDPSHPALSRATLYQHGCAQAVPSAHGTAVASLLIGATGEHGGSSLYSADVYCGLATGGAVDAIGVAFAWLSRERVPVINVSLVGPPNRLLEQIVQRVIARGHLIVAAVGNDGPASPPLYPAAYPGVVAVTGVDARNRVLVEACRGTHVMFAAPGADLTAATLQQRYALVRGTSFAAPIVAGLLARRLATPDAGRAAEAVALLSSEAKDLGSKGTDRTYGKGLVGEALRDSRERVSSME